MKLLSDALRPGWTWSRCGRPCGRSDPPEAATRPARRTFLRRRWLRNNPAQLLATGRQLTVEPDRVDELAAVRPLPKHVLSGETDDTWPVPLLDAMAERLAARRTVIAGPALPEPGPARETAAALTASGTP